MDNETNITLTRKDINLLLSVLQAHKIYLEDEVKVYSRLLKLPKNIDNKIMKISASRMKSELKHTETLYSIFKEAKIALLKGVQEHAKNNN